MNHVFRFDQLRTFLAENKGIAFITERPIDLRYFCDYLDPRGLLVIRGDETSLLYVPAAAAEEAYVTVQGAQVKPIPLGKLLSCELTSALARPGKLFLGEISGPTREMLQWLAPNFSLEDRFNFAEELQRHKDEFETERIAEAVRIAEIGAGAAIQTVKEGVKELDVAAQATAAMMLAGAQALWAPVQVLTGRRSVFADAKVSQKVITRGEMGLVDLGPLYDGYAGDLTRPFVLGNISSDQKKQLQLTQEAQQLALSKVKAGLAASNLYRAVYDFFETNGVAQYFPHALGHGLGLLGASVPYLRPDSEDLLMPGDIITIEPGLYVPGVGGCRIEDVVRVTETDYERISKLTMPWEIDIRS